MGGTPVLDVPERVLYFLATQPTLTLAMALRGGIPRATTLAYANDGVNLYVWTRPETTTARQLEENPLVSFTIHRFSDDLHETQGIQGTGEARVVLNPDELSRAVGSLEQKYPPLAGSLSSGVSIFRIAPTELLFIETAEEGSASGGGASYPRDVVFSVFRDLPREEIETVAATLQTIEVDAGETIVRQGAPADKFFIIVDGEVAVEVDVADGGQPRRLATLSSGQFFGEMAILRETPRLATVRALRPTTLFAMERDAFSGLVAQSLGTTRDFDQVVRQRLDELEA